MAIEALARLAPDDDMVVGTLLAASRDADSQVAIAAISALAATRCHARRAERAVVPCLAHDDARIRAAARRTLDALAA